MGKISEQIRVERAVELQEPPWYSVILLNDDVTTMEFVIIVLMQIFHYSLDEARILMLKVHETGSAVCGIYPHNVAETKVAQVYAMAKANNFPLQCRMEEE